MLLLQDWPQLNFSFLMVLFHLLRTHSLHLFLFKIQINVEFGVIDFLSYSRYLTFRFLRLAAFLTQFLGFKVVVIAKTAAVHELRALLPAGVVVPADVVARTCTLHFR